MFLSICTPTYNREYTLERVYKSLLNQRDIDFEWIIIDDGSTDNTEQLVLSWIKENKMKIKYRFQENQGKHIALNKGISLAIGEMFTCLDSDDWFYETTVKEVNSKYLQIKNDENIAGLIGLDTFEDSEIVGMNFNGFTEKYINWIDLIYKYKIKGDKAYFYKTKILKDYDFPSFRGNKHMPPSYQNYQISKKFNFIIYNKPLKYVEYLEDGISRNKYNKYVVAPDNFSYYRMSIAALIPNKKRRIINAIHFNATQFLGKVRIVPTDIKVKKLFSFFKPIGCLLGIYIKKKANLSTSVSHNINDKK